MSLRSLPGRVLDGAVRVYQRKISRDYNAHNGSRCPYSPSCSQYMRDAVHQDGLIRGSLEGLMRLQRCKRDIAENRMQDFAALLLAEDPSGRHAPSADERIVFRDHQARDVLTQVRDGIEQTRTLTESGRVAEAQSRQQGWSAQLRNELEVWVLDPPGRPTDLPSRFVVGSRSAAPAHEDPPRRFQWLRNAVGAVSGTVGAVAGAAVGIAILGGFEALTAATVLAPVACSGQTDRFNAWLERKYGADTVFGMVDDERRAGKVGYEVHRFVHRGLRSNLLATAVAAPIGIPVGVVAALCHGAYQGARAGWLAGHILGRNLVGASCNHKHGHATVQAAAIGVSSEQPPLSRLRSPGELPRLRAPIPS